jgi:hypothetical protein
VLFLFLACGTLRAQFEGVIESRNTTTDELGAEQQYVMTMWIKGAMAKITTSATSTTPASTMIYRSDLRMIRMLDDDNKTYFEVPQGKTKEDAAAEGGAPAPMKKTGKTKKIPGLPVRTVSHRPGGGGNGDLGDEGSAGAFRGACPCARRGTRGTGNGVER